MTDQPRRTFWQKVTWALFRRPWPEMPAFTPPEERKDYGYVNVTCDVAKDTHIKTYRTAYRLPDDGVGFITIETNKAGRGGDVTLHVTAESARRLADAFATMAEPQREEF